MNAKRLHRYIARAVLSSIGLVTFLLSALQVFILFVNQLEDLGKGNYGLVTAASVVFLQVPYQIYLFFPMASLLGSLIGLGLLANHRELLVMRSAGMSIGQVLLSVFRAAILLILLVTLLGETVVPRLAFIANNQKLQALTSGQFLRTARGIWLRDHNDFIHIGRVLPGDRIERIKQFRFNSGHQLVLARNIQSLQFQQGRWLASGVEESILSPSKIESQKRQSQIWDVPLKPKILRISSNEPDEMNLHELNQYLRVQKMNHQAAYNYQLAFWQRLIQPLTTLIMILLAVPFIFGPLRSSTMGSKLLAGAAVGFGFHIINRIFGPVSLVFQWPVEIAAFAPTLIFGLLGLYLLRRSF